ncbi:MAG: threonine--tRNA ligase, partial [Lachnospiraceae bacterium]|nr:threonine--tRNA ligase [Lachnospiraceae bacterium]
PLQVKVLPVSEKTNDYAAKVNEALENAGVRSFLDDRNEKIGYNIREGQQVDRVPYMLIIGQKEAEDGTVSVRKRDCTDNEVMSLDDFIAKVTEEIRTKAR